MMEKDDRPDPKSLPLPEDERFDIPGVVDDLLDAHPDLKDARFGFSWEEWALSKVGPPVYVRISVVPEYYQRELGIDFLIHVNGPFVKNVFNHRPAENAVRWLEVNLDLALCAASPKYDKNLEPVEDKTGLRKWRRLPPEYSGYGQHVRRFGYGGEESEDFFAAAVQGEQDRQLGIDFLGEEIAAHLKASIPEGIKVEMIEHDGRSVKFEGTGSREAN